MHAYPLQSLIMLRTRRVDEAQRDLTLKREIVNRTKRELESKKQELVDYKNWKMVEINTRYDNLLGMVKTQEEISKFNQGIAALNIKEFNLNEEISKLQKSLEKVQQDYDKALIVVNTAQKALAKLEKHKEIWQVQEKRYEEYLADQELDDFKVQKVQDFE